MGRHHDSAELAERLTAALGATPGASAAALASTLGLARSTTAKALVALESAGCLVREQGGREGTRRLPDRWFVAGAAHGAVAAGGPGAGPTDGGRPDAGLADAGPPEPEGTGAGRDGGGVRADTPAGSTSERLRRGALGGLVLEVLGAHEGDALGPVSIARALGRSSGAVSNALVRLVAAGEVEEVGASPRRYRAATG